MIFYGEVKEGKLKLVREAEFRSLVKLLDGKPVELEIRKRKKKRSTSQNSYYWGVVIPLMQEAFGYPTPEEMHDALRWHFLQKRDCPMPTVKSTTELSTEEFTTYIENCRRVAAEMGVYIPDPGEQLVA